MQPGPSCYGLGPAATVGHGSVCRVPWGGVSRGHELGFAEAAAGSPCEVSCSRLWSPLFPTPVPLAGTGRSGVFPSQGQTRAAGTTRTHGPETAAAPCRRQKGTEGGDSPSTLCLHSREPQQASGPHPGVPRRRRQQEQPDQAFCPREPSGLVRDRSPGTRGLTDQACLPRRVPGWLWRS